jgi:hypothetical protein
VLLAAGADPRPADRHGRTALAAARAGSEGQEGLAAALARRPPPWALPVESEQPAED